MSDAPRTARSPWTAILLGLTAITVVTIYVLLPSGSRAQALASEAMVAITCVLSALVIARAVRAGAWRGAIWLAWALVLVGIGNALFFVLDVSQPGRYQPRPSDAIFLVLMIPLLKLAEAEAKEHFDPRERRELTIDLLLITASLTAILYLLIRPADADAQTSISAAVFALLAATQLAVFCGIALWVPDREHLMQAIAFVVTATATAGFGFQWAHGSFSGTSTWIDLSLALAPLAFAAITLLEPRHRPVHPAEPHRWARPVLTMLAVVSACAALSIVALFDEDRGLDGVQSTVIIVLLGMGVAARIVASQVASTQAHREVRAALTEKEAALQEADQALDRVREANETLRQSEEHLRSVFDAAVDGVVELDERGVVIRANDALCRMVRLDREAVEGQPWTALAAAVTGANEAFASLPEAAEAEVQRAEGQPLFLESRVSQIPTSPPRTLMLVRDVTAARVADQTIRSLFTFLQDRDEDRTRLLRRTNAAIEAERNRVARDLHDGPVQGVSAASLSLEAALLMIKAGDTERGMEVLSRIREELTSEADALRRLMSGLRPPVLEERGLAPALHEMVKRFGDDQGVHAEFASRLSAGLPEYLETLAYRVVQEALSNAAKHAHADMLTVILEADDTQVRIEIQDDGTGFDAAKGREYLRDGRVGLASMRERVELASGTFVVRSSPTRGTTILATLPLETDGVDRELAVDEA
jgi:PAS domain S-box-containing protein